MDRSDWATINHVCPELQAYSRTQLRQAAMDLAHLHDGSPIRLLLKDYAKLREACRLVAERARTRFNPLDQQINALADEMFR